jgi:multicomponent Na+:H+ antiporter subunit G
MLEIIGEVFVFFGSIFILLAAIGLYKMPDYLMKLQAASKASAFGVLLIVFGGNLIVQKWYFSFSSVLVISFLLITTPIGAHALANADKRISKNLKKN